MNSQIDKFVCGYYIELDLAYTNSDILLLISLAAVYPIIKLLVLYRNGYGI
jgi:hypothetical protein